MQGGEAIAYFELLAPRKAVYCIKLYKSVPTGESDDVMKGDAVVHHCHRYSPVPPVPAFEPAVVVAAAAAPQC